MSIATYIRNLQLSDSTLGASPGSDSRDTLGATRSSPPSAPSPRLDLPEDLKSAVNVGSLLSFVDGVTPQERNDTLYSVQLASRGASGTYDRFTDTESWYKKYIEILEEIGWAAEQIAFSRYEQIEGDLRMDEAALAIITAVATQNQLTVLTQAVKALEALAEDDRAISLFDFHSTAQLSGNFQMGAVQRSDGGALALAMGAFYFRSDDTRRRFLFFSWGDHKVNFWTAAQKMTLNVHLYAGHRELVERKLGSKAPAFIAGLNID